MWTQEKSVNKRKPPAEHACTHRQAKTHLPAASLPNGPDWTDTYGNKYSHHRGCHIYHARLPQALYVFQSRYLWTESLHDWWCVSVYLAHLKRQCAVHRSALQRGTVRLAKTSQGKGLRPVIGERDRSQSWWRPPRQTPPLPPVSEPSLPLPRD